MLSKTVLWFCAILTLAPAIGWQRKPAAIESLDQVLTDLASLSESTRAKAKTKLESLGPKSIPVLVALLDRIMHDLSNADDPTFSASEDRLNEVLKTDNRGLVVARQLAHNVAVHDQLAKDLVEVLAKMGPREAVLLFTKYLYGLIDESTGTSLRFNKGMTGLVLMGEKAVPNVLEVFYNADSLASVSWGGIHTSIRQTRRN